MRKLLAVLAVVGLVGCGESGITSFGRSGPLAISEGTYTPAAYPAQANTALLDFIKLRIGAGVSAVLPENSSLDNTYMLDITAQLDIPLGGLLVEASLGWKTYDYYNETLTDGGELTIKPIYLTALFAKGSDAGKIYMGGGMQWDITEVEEITGLSTDDTVGFHAVVGASLSQGIFTFQAEVRYTFTDISIDYTNPLEPDVEIEGDELLARIKFLFDF